MKAYKGKLMCLCTKHKQRTRAKFSKHLTSLEFQQGNWSDDVSLTEKKNILIYMNGPKNMNGPRIFSILVII